MTKDNRTDDEINRVIAEWCGWEYVSNGCGYETRYVGTPSETRVFVPVPNYCDDLNAVHQAWLKLNKDEKHRFQDALQRVLLSRLQASCWIIGAEARQRAEALVKVIEEGKK